jgi:phosphorylated CTD-interacting factor 1
MMTSVRGDDDVLAILDEMSGGIVNNGGTLRPQPMPSSIGSMGVNPHVEVVRHRCHEKFKSGFYDLFRSCCVSRTTSAMSTTNTTTTTVKKLMTVDDTVYMTMARVWSAIPPHLIWERYQFGLKTLEAECIVRDNTSDESNDGLGGGGQSSSLSLLQQQRPYTVHQELVRIINGKRQGKIWEPLLPVPTIITNDDEVDGVVNGRYRNGMLALLRGEVEFEFRRTFKKQKRSRRELDELCTSMIIEDVDDNSNDNNIEECILRMIFESKPFQRVTQKLHKKFIYLAEEWYSTFLSDLRKCANRCIVEEEEGHSRDHARGGKKRKHNNKRGRNGGSECGLPKITEESYSNNTNQDRNEDGQRLVVTFVGISLRINAMHETKLRSMYQYTLHRRCGTADVEELMRYEYPRQLFSLLLRYDALEGAGLQSAIPRGVFHYLRTRFGSVFECFASPFNCNWSGNEPVQVDDDNDKGKFGSAFFDTDSPFGSAGNFFDLDFTNGGRGGCYQANPPFASEFIERMCHRMNDVMTTNDDHGTGIPLMFVVFVPAWSDSIGYRTLQSSPYIVRHILLSQKNDVHYYAEGTQHRRRVAANGNGCGINGHRIASFDTSVFYLQNDAAKVRWPLGDDDERMLKTAFAMNPGNEQEKVHTHLKEARLQIPQAEVSSASNRSTNRTSSQTTSSSSKRKLEAKNTAVKERGSLKKNKLISGGQDELGILKGILDDGSIRATMEASIGKVHKAKSNNKNRKKSRNHR